MHRKTVVIQFCRFSWRPSLSSCHRIQPEPSTRNHASSNLNFKFTYHASQNCSHPILPVQLAAQSILRRKAVLIRRPRRHRRKSAAHPYSGVIQLEFQLPKDRFCEIKFAFDSGFAIILCWPLVIIPFYRPWPRDSRPTRGASGIQSHRNPVRVESSHHRNPVTVIGPGPL